MQEEDRKPKQQRLSQNFGFWESFNTMILWVKFRAKPGEVVLEEVLGKEYRGITPCGFFSAYRKFFRASGALAH
jgi:hypothetical protein